MEGPKRWFSSFDGCRTCDARGVSSKTLRGKEKWKDAVGIADAIRKIARHNGIPWGRMIEIWQESLFPEHRLTSGFMVIRTEVRLKRIFHLQGTWPVFSKSVRPIQELFSAFAKSLRFMAIGFSIQAETVQSCFENGDFEETRRPSPWWRDS